ncbi:conserved hypothetical protein [Frankia sp. Hr75.2]|nr:conserved hypothetical protein [Frankia sp. Hr75.2]
MTPGPGRTTSSCTPRSTTRGRRCRPGRPASCTRSAEPRSRSGSTCPWRRCSSPSRFSACCSRTPRARSSGTTSCSGASPRSGGSCCAGSSANTHADDRTPATRPRCPSRSGRPNRPRRSRRSRRPTGPRGSITPGCPTGPSCRPGTCGSSSPPDGRAPAGNGPRCRGCPRSRRHHHPVVRAAARRYMSGRHTAARRTEPPRAAARAPVGRRRRTSSGPRFCRARPRAEAPLRCRRRPASGTAMILSRWTCSNRNSAAVPTDREAAGETLAASLRSRYESLTLRYRLCSQIGSVRSWPWSDDRAGRSCGGPKLTPLHLPPKGLASAFAQLRLTGTSPRAWRPEAGAA